MTSNLSPMQFRPPVGERDHVQGRADAPLTLLEYGDFESPACGRAYQIVTDVLSSLDGRLRFVFRHFPLSQAHPHAQQAAEAAEEAAVQGRFWPMHDRLFEWQGMLDDAHLRQHAVILGLDTNAFDQAMATHRHAGRVREDVLSGEQSGITDTPTFFINGVRYYGPCDVDGLLEALFQAEVQLIANSGF